MFWLMPVFFIWTGLKTSWTLDLSTILLGAVGMFIIAVVTKFVGVWLAYRDQGMRVVCFKTALLQTKGLMEIFLVTMLLTAGIISVNMFAAVVIMSLISTIVAVPLARLFYKPELDNNSKYINDIIVSKQPLKNRYILNPNVYGYNLNNVSIAFNNNYNSFINNLGILFTLKMNNMINSNLLTINDYYNDIISINIMHSNKQKNNNDKIVNIVDNYGLINVDEDYNLNIKKEYNIEILTNGYKYYRLV
jgi:hypothetical protein